MCVEGNGSEASHAAWNGSEECSNEHLAELCLAEAFEEQAFGFDVQRLDHHHHDDDKSGYEYCVTQCVYKYVQHYSIQPVMKRFTIGRRGEFVVRVTIVSISPSGIFDVSMSTVNDVHSPGCVGGILLCDHFGASMSTL